jgi:hypothetical protein
VKFHKITSLVHVFCKINKNGPWYLKTLKKSILVLVLLIFGRNGPWVKSLVKVHVWSLEFQKLAVLVPEGPKVKNLSYKPWTMETWQKYTLKQLWEIGKPGP